MIPLAHTDGFAWTFNHDERRGEWSPTLILALLNIVLMPLQLLRRMFSEAWPFYSASLAEWFTAYSSARIGGSGHVCK